MGKSVQVSRLEMIEARFPKQREGNVKFQGNGGTKTHGTVITGPFPGLGHGCC